MQFKSFVIPVGNASEMESELNAFLRSHRIITIDKEFITGGNNSSWAFMVEYLPSNSVSDNKTKSSLDYKEILNDKDFALFAHLRDFRKQIALEENVPVFVVFTNAQLAAIAEQRPDSLTALGKIDGIGKGKCDRYGESFLKAVQEHIAKNEKTE